MEHEEFDLAFLGCTTRICALTLNLGNHSQLFRRRISKVLIFGWCMYEIFVYFQSHEVEV